MISVKKWLYQTLLFGPLWGLMLCYGHRLLFMGSPSFRPVPVSLCVLYGICIVGLGLVSTHKEE